MDDSDQSSAFDPTSAEGREVAGRVAREESDFLALMAHHYRAEMGRTVSWRNRLDRTTNWAVVITASLITWGFSSGDRPHYVMLVGMVMVCVFLWIEARRYRMYDVFRSRVRILEENVLANALDPDGAPHRSWRKLLSEDLHEPALKTPMAEAISRRLRRVYLPLLLVLLVAWIVRITAFSAPGVGVWATARIARVSSPVVWVALLLFYGGVVALAFWPKRRRAKGSLTADPDAAEDWKDDF